MKIAVDFDGVIINHPDIPTRLDWFNDVPTRGCKDALWFLVDQGHYLYVFTNRPKKDWEKMRLWMIKYNMPGLYITNEKEEGTSIYLDDRAIRFTSWKDFTKYIS
jgi:hypothetical protein